jgi:hypothetical protein
MAVDSRDKRGSTLLLALQFARIWPNPDGSLVGDDRQHLGYLYRGISATAATVMALERAITRRVFGRIFGRVN